MRRRHETIQDVVNRLIWECYDEHGWVESPDPIVFGPRRHWDDAWSRGARTTTVTGDAPGGRLITGRRLGRNRTWNEVRRELGVDGNDETARLTTYTQEMTVMNDTTTPTEFYRQQLTPYSPGDAASTAELYRRLYGVNWWRH